MTKNEKAYLRTLVSKLLGHIHSQRNINLTSQWRALNDLESANPLVLVSPEGAWNEIEENWVLQCESEYARIIEKQIRKIIYKIEFIGDDSTIDPFLTIPLSYEHSGFGVDVTHQQSNMERGSYAITPTVSDIDEGLEKLKFRQFTALESKNINAMDEVREALGDLIEIRFDSAMDWTNGLTKDVIDFIGMEKLMFSMYDDPEGLHRLMSFMRDERLNWISQMEQTGSLALNSGANLIGSGNLGHTGSLPQIGHAESDDVRLKDIWGFSESQETVGISPDMFGEFIFPYQKPIIEKFGLSYYGCCEPVEERFDYVKTISNLRCVSVSPWSNIEKCSELYGRNYVLCCKPNPSPICTGYDEKALRGEIQSILRTAGDLNLMFVLKDTHTIGNEPDRFVRWVKMVREEIDNHSRV